MEIVEQGKAVDLHADSHSQGHLSTAEQNYLLKTGWWVYIASEIMLFSSFIAVMFLAHRLYPEMQDMLAIPLTTFNTFLLLTSSWMLAVGLAAIQKGDVTTLQRNLFITMALGAIFVGIQIYEYQELSHK
ncbi:MAG: heme-copper oxidase subunit III, partial [Anaerolineales bacterium]